MSTEEVEEATRELLALLPLLNRIVAAEARRELGEETTMPQFRALGLLGEAPMTLSALAKKRRVSLQSMGELAQALVARGWIMRTPDPTDRRQQMLHLTGEGRLHYERAQEHMLRRLIPLVGRLHAQELAAVRTALPALQRVLAGDEDIPV
jgi:DNA-binding MarR family transcriptional regulator